MKCVGNVIPAISYLGDFFEKSEFLSAGLPAVQTAGIAFTQRSIFFGLSLQGASCKMSIVTWH